MRSGPNTRRPMRRGNSGGGGGGRRNGSPRSQNFDSNGPDVKVRGNAQQVVDKYQTLAREAATAGDPVMAENYYQHAEHYYRLMNANGGGDNRQGGRSADGDRDRDNADGDRNRDNGGTARQSSGNGNAAEASAADDGDESARDGGQTTTRKAAREPAASTAAAEAEEAGEPLS